MTASQLRSLRIRRHIKQIALAALLGVYESRLCQYELGKRQPTAEFLRRWQEALRA